MHSCDRACVHSCDRVCEVCTHAIVSVSHSCDNMGKGGVRAMKVNYIPAAVTLLAGAITCIYTIVKGWDTLQALATLLAVLIVFYIIGQLAKKVIVMVMDSNRVTKQASTVEEDDEEEPQFEEDGMKEEVAE